MPAAKRDDAIKQVVDLGIPILLSANRRFHQLLVTGVPVQYQKDGRSLCSKLFARCYSH
jgi:type I restriction enzyme R subunit